MAQARDRWPELCELVKVDDELPVREAGPWTEQKLHFWSKYLDITTTAMSGKPQWPGGLVYVDLFAGPGVCQIRGSGRRVPGSVLIAAHQRKPFAKIIACELDRSVAAACRTRLAASGTPSQWEVIEGDCNTCIDAVCNAIPQNALTLAFIDPISLHAHFETVATLARDRRADLLILFADRYDIVRNVAFYAAQTDSNLDKVMGPGCDWRRAWADLPNQSGDHIAKLFADLYQHQLATKLGYGSSTHVIRKQNLPLYRLVFASKHPKGIEFWQKAIARDLSGQRELF